MKTIAIQGCEGSFHQIAARNYLNEEITVISCDTFGAVVKQTAAEASCDGGFIAIENSIAGSILPNYALLQKSDLRISGEIYLHINQNLLVNPGVDLQDIREVHSHPMALLQCIDFLEKYPHWKLVETTDTALSAKHIQQHKHKHAAAIASKLAAEMFELDVIVPKIQTNKNNYTRFLYLQRVDQFQPVPDADKASVSFQTDHSKGALAKLLTVIAAGNINLSKLQSMPIQSSAWKYNFHVDMEFETIAEFEHVITQMKAMVQELKIFGVYKKGVTVSE